MDDGGIKAASIIFGRSAAGRQGRQVPGSCGEIRPRGKGGHSQGVYPSISVMRADALTPRTREISMNSRTLSCRSPASSFHTNEFDRFSFAANCRCVRPAACRASTMTAMSARCLALRRCFNVLFPQEMRHS